MAADTPTGSHRSLENTPSSLAHCRFHVGGELIHKQFERHYLARRQISLEQVPRIFTFCLGTKEVRRNVRTRDEHRGRQDTREICAQWLAAALSASTERRLRALSRLPPSLQGRVHSRQGSICSPKHGLVQRPDRVLSRRRSSSHNSGNRLHQKLRSQCRASLVPIAGRNCRCRENNQCRLCETFPRRSRSGTRIFRSRERGQINSRPRWNLILPL